MLEEIEQRKFYVCQVCRMKSVNKSHIEACERSHNCDHKSTKVNDESEYAGPLYLKKVCSKCGHTISIFNSNNIDQNAANEIFKVIEEKFPNLLEQA